MATSVQESQESTSFQLGLNALPQYGFGPNLTFDDLVRHNPFLFRVYTPKPLPPFFDNSQPFFIGRRFKSFSRFDEEEMEPQASGPLATYADAVNHLDSVQKTTSPYITTSFSFAWAIWEAARRYHINPSHEIEIAIIDARALADRAVTTLEVLRSGTPEERHPDHWKWYKFATEAQDALVYGYIPGTAVLASVPILSLLPKLPSYFLDPESTGDEKHFNSLAWDVSAPRGSFQLFCQQLSDQFLRSSTDIRLRDTTAGAVHLAMGFLRPWLQQHAAKQFHETVDLVAELAYIIARWPGRWWVREHPEIWDLIQAMIHVIGEEVRDAQRAHALGEVMRLEGVVSELQLLTEEYVYVHSRPGSSASRSRSSSIDETDLETSIVQIPYEDTVPASPISSADVVSLPASGVETVSYVLSSFFFGVFASLVFVSGRSYEFPAAFT